MKYALDDEPMFHYEFRGGRWWSCVQDDCDGVHHYYVAT